MPWVGDLGAALSCLQTFVAQLLVASIIIHLSALRPEPTIHLFRLFLPFAFAPGLTGMVARCTADLPQCGWDLWGAAFQATPTLRAVQFLAAFNGLALVLDQFLPGDTKYGPETKTGHVPAYCDNAVAHCIVFTIVFVGASNLLWDGYYDFGIMFDEFAPILSCLNIIGLSLSAFLYVKGLNFPSTADCGSSGSMLIDFVWGTELYPRVFGVDIKRFVNCRFSMTFWMVAGLSFSYRSFTLHGEIDYGLLLGAVSQFLYLFKFFTWEIGYMRSIDIIVDRAGFEIQWGCLVWVPSLYTLHSRFCVVNPSGLSREAAGAIFAVGLLGVILNYIADLERQNFRECDGKMKIWGKEPVYIKATYTALDPATNKQVVRTSLLLASGFWGVARHFHYVFELTAAWSWCFLANPFNNGVVPLFYAAFLTILLLHRAKRDEVKCTNKYGKDYSEKYCSIVPYLVLPGVY